MKKWSVQLLFIIIFLFILNGCSSKFESVSEHNERLATESKKRQEILNQIDESDSTSVDTAKGITSNKQSEPNNGSKTESKPNNTTKVKSSPSKTTHKNASDSKKKKTKETTSSKTTFSKAKKNSSSNTQEKKDKTNNNTTKPETTTEQTQSEYIIVYLTISCIDVLSHPSYANDNSLPSNGFIISKEMIPIKRGDSAFTAVQAMCNDKKIQLSYTGSVKNETVYINSIYNIKEKKYGKYSGWMYKVGGTSQGVGISSYIPKDGDQIELYYVTS